ncbi:hypothetical protein HDU83_000096 [Entophlyctis luteolus]|nr:hypothetical protein HDU83_000096 [Entophlyctis luteolus]KAJ3395314.1 hypothetical protein HDU84_000081 [Entophlyctis sp. JEL0112]
MQLWVSALLLSQAVAVLGHPGQSHEETPLKREFTKVYRDVNRRSLHSACGSNVAARDIDSAAERRDRKIAQLRDSLGLSRRDAASFLAETHLATRTGLSPSSSAADVFGTTVACILEPEATYGPYYVEGEYVRSDIRESQQGVPLYLDVQIVDTTTCTTIPEVYVEFWHTNATGVYSGVAANGNGNADDLSNLEATFLRGLVKTDSDGIASVSTNFPGHYTGRTTHVHIMAHMNGTLYPNNTYMSTNFAHIGQLFFDQSLISEVEAVNPYSTNTQAQTLNSDDSIFTGEASTTFDPIVSYVLLGDSVSDGIFAWISIGLNPEYNQNVDPAGYLQANSNSASTSATGASTDNTGTAATTTIVKTAKTTSIASSGFVRLSLCAALWFLGFALL